MTRWTAVSCWRVVPVAVALPFALVLCRVLWMSPYPLSEAVALFEDAADRPVAEFLWPSSAYYRPLFHVTLAAIWNRAPSIDRALAWVKISLHIVPAAALILLFAWHLRPRTAIHAAAALVALAALIGAPGLLGNLELPLSYTIVGMPLALGAWMLLERPRSRASDLAVVALMLAAIGFKEQGLIVAPLIVVAWWMGAPGAGRGTAIAASAVSAAYVVFRLATRSPDLPMFEQAIGYGFQELSPADAEARWGAFPIGIYLYNSLATIGSLLLAEPTDGVFRLVQASGNGSLRPWQLVYVGSSAASTALVLWWGRREIRRCGPGPWSVEARVFAAAVVAVAGCGVLSFNYSRERLGGMAVPFYALAVYWAVAAAATRAAAARTRALALVATAALVVLSAAWQCRAIYTIEFTRQRAVNTQREWLTDLGARRERFSGRSTYLRIMDAMTEQGASPNGVQRTPYPRWLSQLLGE